MRARIERSAKFKRDFKRELRTHGQELNDFLDTVLCFLSADAPLPGHYRDHKLAGRWDGCRECHMKPDLLLIYAKPDDSVLWLVRIGSHANLLDL